MTIWWNATTPNDRIINNKRKQAVFIINFGEKLQLLRKQKGMSQEQLASQLTVSRQAISKWELNGSFPDTENVIKLSELFDVSTDYLLKNDAENIKENLMPVTNKKEKYTILAGIGCLLFSCVSFFVVWILEKIYPAPIVSYNPETQLWKVGLDNFIWIHGLENFMFILGIVLVIGIGLICHKQIKKLYKFIQVKLKRTKWA